MRLTLTCLAKVSLRSQQKMSSECRKYKRSTYDLFGQGYAVISAIYSAEGIFETKLQCNCHYNAYVLKSSCLRNVLTVQVANLDRSLGTREHRFDSAQVKRIREHACWPKLSEDTDGEDESYCTLGIYAKCVFWCSSLLDSNTSSWLWVPAVGSDQRGSKSRMFLHRTLHDLYALICIRLSRHTRNVHWKCDILNW